jgi:hypothetical protein
LSADGKQGIVEMKIDDLPSEFLKTELQIERLSALPQYIVKNHIQVVNHNGTHYHLNPDNFTRIQHWHWLIYNFVQQILVWQYSMMNYSWMLINQPYGIAF